MKHASIHSAVPTERDRLRGRGIAHALARWVRGLAVARLRRRAIRELQKIDDRTLADIGLSRGEIEFAVQYGRDGVARLSPFQRSVRALAALHFPPP